MEKLIRIVFLGILWCYGILFGGALLIAFINYVVKKIIKNSRKRKWNRIEKQLRGHQINCLWVEEVFKDEQDKV